MSAVYLADRRAASDETGEVFFTSSGIPLFELLIPFGSRFAVGFGYDADQDLGTARTRYAFVPSGGPDVSYTRHYERKGSLFRVPAALSFRLLEDVRLGVRLDNYFLNSEDIYDLDFDDSSIRSTRERLRIGCSGVGATFGVLLPLPGRARVGLVYGTSAVLDGDAERVGGSGSVRTDPVEVGLPERMGAGFSVPLPGGWTAGADVLLASWSEVEDTIAAPGGYRDALSWAVGIERAPQEDDPWFLRLPLRAGFRVDPMSYRSAEEKDVPRWLATAGSGVPLGGGRGMCDFGVEYGKIGNPDLGLEESYVRLLLGFIGQEPWKRRKSYLE
jgi:hypothetical protein